MDKGLIVHTEASTGRGGQEARTFTEMEYMRAQGYRCVLAAPANADLYQRCQQAGYECWAVSFGKWTQWGDFWRLCGLFHRHKPLVVATHSAVDTRVALAAATAAQVPVRLRYRHVSIPVKNTPFNRYLYHHWADGVITTAEMITQALVRDLGLPAAKVRTIATGIQPPVPLLERHLARQKVQESLGLPATARFVGMMAEMRYWKGHVHLMKAFEQLAEHRPDYHLLLVGGGASLENYKSWAQQLKHKARVHFVGHRKDFYDYFGAMDVAVLASTQNEGIPQTLIHAMFAQTPVVGTNVGGIPELVKDGKTGLIVPPADEPALYAALEETLNNPAATAQRVAAALAQAQTHHTVEVMGRQVQAMIDRILAEKA